MQLGGQNVLSAYLQPGLLLRFLPGTLFGTEKSHYAVVVNQKPLSDGEVVLVCATTKYERRREIAVRQRQPAWTVVHLPVGAHPKFTEGKTGFDCNHPVKISMDELCLYYDRGKVVMPPNNHILNIKFVNQISEGIQISDLVSDDVKKLV